MLVRRLLLLVAVVAAGVLPTSAATAASTKCVALVVDATALGGSVSSSCVTVPTDSSSADVLVKSGHRVTFDPRYGDNFVCAIDGRPAGGCHATDATHFWVYYHRSPHGTSWQESSEGAGTYQPANASSDGWVYNDGRSSAPQPANVPYSSICRSAASASPTPSATHRTSAGPQHQGAPARSARSQATPAPSSAAVAGATPSAALSHPGSSGPTPPTSAQPTVAATVAPSADAANTADTASASPAAADQPASSRRSGFPVALVVALVAAGLVAGAAVARARRSRE